MKTRVAVVLAFLFFATGSANAFQPRTGHWNSLPSESGRGFNVDIQDGVIVLTVYAYDANGLAQWYIASGPMTNGQRNFTGTLDKFVGGQCLTCAYTAPISNGNDGTISVAFTSETAAIVTLPGGRSTTIHPFNFKYGDPPQGLLGEWVYVYDIISTFGDRFNYTVLRAATANGTGTAWDDSRDSACELQVSGVLAGEVVCIQFGVGGSILNSYVYNYGVDETFAGQWVSVAPAAAFPMKGFRIRGASGFAKSMLRPPPPSTTDSVKNLQITDTGPSASPYSAELSTLAASMRSTREYRALTPIVATQ